MSSIVVPVDGPCFEYPKVLKSLNRVLDGTPKMRVSDVITFAQRSRRLGRLSGSSIGLGRLRSRLVFHIQSQGWVSDGYKGVEHISRGTIIVPGGPALAYAPLSTLNPKACSSSEGTYLMST